MNAKDMAGKTAIVTGGAGAFGAAIGREFADRGASVVLADLDGDGAKKVAEDIGRKSTSPTIGVACDVSDEKDVQKMVQEAVSAFRHVDVLVNNAGIFPMGPLLETTVEKWDKIMAINVRGVFLCSKQVLPLMIEQKSGCLVNIASVVGRMALPNLIPYSVSKSAVIAMTVGMAKEFAPYGIRVNAVCPSSVGTPGWAESKKVMAGVFGMPEDQVLDAIIQGQLIKRMLTPEEIARMVAWLASEETAMVTGQAIGLDGGSVFPQY